VRARDVRGTAGVDARRAERELGRVLVDRGFSIDLEWPDHELRAVFAGDVCALGWLDVEGERGFGERAPTEKPFFQPGSMDPIEARAVANIAGARPGATILDPMCGTGGILVEAGLVGARVVGFDAQPKMVRGARRNLAHYLEGGDSPAFDVGLADAGRLPLRDGSVDGVVVDVPYGRQSKVASPDLEALVGDVLGEARRVAGRAVAVADRSRAAAAEEAGWRVEAVFERPVHRSLTRYVHVLSAPTG
jgi:tRNA (guanine10-N2)-dimethyltransferase